MSSRQMRRLQDLVDRATGLDADDEAEMDDDVALPNTMQSKKSADRHSEKKKAKKDKRKAAPADAPLPSAAAVASAPPQASTKAVSSSAPTAQPSAASPSSPGDWEEVEDEDDCTTRTPTVKESNTAASASGGKRASGHAEDGGAEATAAAARTAAQVEEEKKRKKEEKRKLRQQQQRQMQAEEDALLDAVIATHGDPQSSMMDGGVAGGGSAPHSPNSATGAASAGDGNALAAAASATAADAASLAHFVMACDPQQLDTRLERIRLFGVDAVEDVGDGRTPHRRADGRLRDSGTVSFFPAHHVHVKFGQSAFATPNRYRWVPYDSLGIYLTTEEISGPSGRSVLEYTLNCGSNAFQRALQQLRACQEHLGGVQELVECLARNKVYHIPTLLQCVYAMEATGESTFATELLEVALYQLGVVLRRFTLAGTWAQRRLLMARGGNGMLFQVLQRGVHAALKRGCLRTAFERARCLLSLDPRDPCGMLLLLDYTALRAKRWVWLLEMRQRVLAASSAAAAAASSAGGQDGSLARCLASLPNFAFSWALARHFIEREEQMQGSSSGGSSGGRPSKVLRGLTAVQRAALDGAPPAQELLIAALTHFPHAAVALVNALGGVETVVGSDDLPVSDASIWFGDVVVRAESAPESDEAHLQGHLANLFVARHEELWKLNECISVLRAAARALMETPKSRESAATRSFAAAASPADVAAVEPHAYLALAKEAVLGTSVTAIPAELLRPDPLMQDGEGGDNVDGVGMNPQMVRELIRMLRGQGANNGENAGEAEAFAQRLERELAGDNDDADDSAGADAGGENGHLDWYDFDDEEAAEGQEWYSVASGEDRSSSGDDAEGGAQ